MDYDELLQNITSQEAEDFYRTLGPDELVAEITELRKALLMCHVCLQETPLEYDGSDLEQIVAELVGDLDGPD